MGDIHSVTGQIQTVQTQRQDNSSLNSLVAQAQQDLACTANPSVVRNNFIARTTAMGTFVANGNNGYCLKGNPSVQISTVQLNSLGLQFIGGHFIIRSSTQASTLLASLSLFGNMLSA